MDNFTCRDDEDNSGLQKVVCEQPDFDMEDSKESQGKNNLSQFTAVFISNTI